MKKAVDLNLDNFKSHLKTLGDYNRYDVILNRLVNLCLI